MFYPSEIAERIKMLAKEKHTTVKDVCKGSGVGEKFVSNMGGINGSYPQSDKIAKVAFFLDVSVDYLLGRTEQKNNATVPIKGDSSTQMLIEKYYMLNDNAQNELLNYLEYMTTKPENLRQEDNKRAV